MSQVRPLRYLLACVSENEIQMAYGYLLFHHVPPTSGFFS